MLHFVPIPPRPSAGCHWEERGSILGTLPFMCPCTPLRSPRSPLQPTEPQLPQPFPLQRLSRPALDSPRHVPALLEPDTGCPVRPHQGRAEGQEDPSRPTEHPPANTPQDAIALPGHKGAALAHAHPAHQDPQVPLRCSPTGHSPTRTGPWGCSDPDLTPYTSPWYLPSRFPQPSSPARWQHSLLPCHPLLSVPTPPIEHPKPWMPPPFIPAPWMDPSPPLQGQWSTQWAAREPIAPLH